MYIKLFSLKGMYFPDDSFFQNFGKTMLAMLCIKKFNNKK